MQNDGSAPHSPLDPVWIRLAQAKFVLNAFLWFGFGVISLPLLGSAGANSLMGALVVAVLMFGTAAALLVCAIRSAAPSRQSHEQSHPERPAGAKDP